MAYTTIHNFIVYDVLTYHGIGHHDSSFGGTYGSHAKHITRIFQCTIHHKVHIICMLLQKSQIHNNQLYYAMNREDPSFYEIISYLYRGDKVSITKALRSAWSSGTVDCICMQMQDCNLSCLCTLSMIWYIYVYTYIHHMIITWHLWFVET